MKLPAAVRAKLLALRAQALRIELRLAPTETQRLFVLTLVIGFGCGFAAVAFHFAISFFDRLLFQRAIAVQGRAWIAWAIVSPTVGGLLAGLLLRFVFPNARGS